MIKETELKVIMKLHDTTIRMFKGRIQTMPSAASGTSKRKTLASPLGKIVSGIYLLKLDQCILQDPTIPFWIYTPEMYTKSTKVMYKHIRSHIICNSQARVIQFLYECKNE